MRLSASQRDRDTGVLSIEDELCIWMKARVINFKLCDKTYDCLNCAFDKAMTEAWSKAPGVGTGSAEGFHGTGKCSGLREEVE